ncbi:MAG: LysR family transcriptional regulator [Sneathiella sp.]
MFNWDDIQVFLAVTRAGTVRGAAKELGVTHATISRRLRELEKRLGSELFERSSTRHKLSTAGHSIFDAAVRAQENMAEIDRRAFAQDRSLAGKVKLSVLESLYMAVLNERFHQFHTENPLIEVELITSEQLKNLAQREADIVIRITNSPPEQAFGRKLANSPLACYASVDYLANRPELDRWVALEHETAREPIIPARLVMTTNSLNVSAETIRQGTGLGLLPCFIGDKSPDLVRVPGTPLIPDMEIWALMHADVQNTPRVRALINFIYDVFDSERDLIEGRI